MHTKDDKVRALVAPLDWGLGHAARCVPIINELINQNIQPVIAAYGKSLKFFKLEFPGHEIIYFPGLDIKYPSNSSLALKMIFSFPYIIFKFIKEHFTLKSIIDKHEIDIIISDGRFGLWNKKVLSVFLNHQINIKLPSALSFLEYPLYLFNRFAVSMFDQCWIPDVPHVPNLSGELSTKYKLKKNFKFIGPLSRLKINNDRSRKTKYDCGFILSGPEPQRTIFEDIILKQIKNIKDKKVLVLRGLPGDNSMREDLPDNIEIRNHIKSSELEIILAQSGLIISRPGYSTVMDLSVNGGRAVFIPTPGQTEQEYLAGYYEKNGWAPYFNQNEFNLKTALKKVENYSGIPKINSTDLLADAVKTLIE